MSKPLLLTAAYDGSDGPYAGMIDDWEPHHRAYCEKNDMGMIPYRTLYEGGVEGKTPFWAKAHIILNELRFKHFSHVIWMDTDAIIARTDINLTDALPYWAWIGMTIHPYRNREDLWHFQSGVIYIRCCDESIKFFEHVIEQENKPQEGGFVYNCEQEAMHGLFNRYPDYQKGLVVLPFQWNNTLHDQQSAPIVAAFHGQGTPEQRREIMRAWGNNYFRYKSI